MYITKNTYFHIVALVFFVMLKFFYSTANNDAISILTKPTSALVSLITNTNATYNNNSGFYIEKLNIIIDKSCSGFNFWMLCFILFFFILLKPIKKTVFKIILLPISIILSFLATLFVNTSRILISLFIEHKTGLNYRWLHQAEGVFVYLLFLIFFFFITNYIQAKYIKNYEKFT